MQLEWLYFVSFQTVIPHLPYSLVDPWLRWLDVSLPNSLRLLSLGLMVENVAMGQVPSHPSTLILPVIIIPEFGVPLS